MVKRKKKVKKEVKNKEKVESPDKKIAEQQNKQTMWILIILATIFAIVFLVAWSIHLKSNFEYYGVKFKKTKFGKIPFFQATIKVITGNTIRDQTINLRKDPRKLQVPFDAQIRFRKNIIFISIGSGLEKCGNSGIAVVNLARFISIMGLKAKGAVANESEQIENIPYVNCINRKENTVIMIKKADEGNFTSIKQDEKNPDCYIINIANCEILEATEKFMLETIKSVKR